MWCVVNRDDARARGSHKGLSRNESRIANVTGLGAHILIVYGNITFGTYTRREHNLERTRLNIALSYTLNDQTKKGKETINDPLK